MYRRPVTRPVPDADEPTIEIVGLAPATVPTTEEFWPDVATGGAPPTPPHRPANGPTRADRAPADDPVRVAPADNAPTTADAASGWAPADPASAPAAASASAASGWAPADPASAPADTASVSASAGTAPSIFDPVPGRVEPAAVPAEAAPRRVEAGAPPADAGPRPVDAGPSPDEAAVKPADAAPHSVESAAVPADPAPGWVAGALGRVDGGYQHDPWEPLVGDVGPGPDDHRLGMSPWPPVGPPDDGLLIDVDGTPADGSPPPRRRWSRGTRWLTAAVVVVLALGAAAVAATLAAPNPLGVAFSGDGDGRPPTGETAVPAEPAPDGALTAALDGRRAATFELLDGLTTLALRADDLGDDLYRIGAPAGGVRPEPQLRGDKVRLYVEQTGRPGPGVVDVVLNSRVTWQLKIVGGVDEQVLDLSRGRLAGVELIGGATRVDLRLPQVTGTLSVRMSGGLNELLIRSAGDPPARVRAASGAGTIRVYDQRQAGIAAGQVVDSPQWDNATDRIWVDLVAGANLVTVGRS
ncbi:hypothetical protein GA0070617_3470 [Micromonospora yangpuensis]|uniref:Uncharacterized protein n=1 Tax=Micromonospora yangpuensis TaxID=683228 RepID=A0A1C6UT19_9ACTN|nr:hypothetical protein GA0070617_3470 [Micromonospora yangpuensis]